MRPRVFPAEDAPRRRRRGGPPRRFNEAAGIPRGRPPPRWTDEDLTGRFNEAAGIPRGRRVILTSGGSGTRRLQ